MNKELAVHSQFTIERTLPHAPSRVFAAWADSSLKVRWFVGPNGWEQRERSLDFRVGGTEIIDGGPKGAPSHRYVARYYDIVPNQRIVLTYEMYEGDTRMSVSLATLTFEPAGKGTRMTFTEQLVYIDGKEWGDSREVGTRALLDQLEAFLAAS